MSSEIYQVWAPPLEWGPWTHIDVLMGGPFEVTLEADSVSNVPSSFSGEAWFFDGAGEASVRSFECPGGITFVTGADIVRQPKMRFRSHGAGQNVRVLCSVRTLRDGRPPRGLRESGVSALLGRPPAEWTRDDVLRVRGSDAYRRSCDPLHDKAVDSVLRYYSDF